MGGLLGLCSGFFIKKLGKFFIFYIGMTVVTLQILVHFNIVSVEWRTLERKFKRSLDVDGDGEVSIHDWASLIKRGLAVLTVNLPFNTTFLTGLWVGYRFG